MEQIGEPGSYIVRVNCCSLPEKSWFFMARFEAMVITRANLLSGKFKNSQGTFTTRTFSFKTISSPQFI